MNPAQNELWVRCPWGLYCVPHWSSKPDPCIGHALRNYVNFARNTDKLAALQGGYALDEEVLAQEVADLVDRVACARCLVWAKSDAVVARAKAAAPELRVGYVVVNETAAHRAAGADRLLRMRSAQARVKPPFSSCWHRSWVSV